MDDVIRGRGNLGRLSVEFGEWKDRHRHLSARAMPSCCSGSRMTRSAGQHCHGHEELAGRLPAEPSQTFPVCAMVEDLNAISGWTLVGEGAELGARREAGRELAADDGSDGECAAALPAWFRANSADLGIDSPIVPLAGQLDVPLPMLERALRAARCAGRGARGAFQHDPVAAGH